MGKIYWLMGEMIYILFGRYKSLSFFKASFDTDNVYN